MTWFLTWMLLGWKTTDISGRDEEKESGESDGERLRREEDEDAGKKRRKITDVCCPLAPYDRSIGSHLPLPTHPSKGQPSQLYSAQLILGGNLEQTTMGNESLSSLKIICILFCLSKNYIQPIHRHTPFLAESGAHVAALEGGL